MYLSFFLNYLFSRCSGVNSRVKHCPDAREHPHSHTHFRGLRLRVIPPRTESKRTPQVPSSGTSTSVGGDACTPHHLQRIAQTRGARRHRKTKTHIIQETPPRGSKATYLGVWNERNFTRVQPVLQPSRLDRKSSQGRPGCVQQHAWANVGEEHATLDLLHRNRLLVVNQLGI